MVTIDDDAIGPIDFILIELDPDKLRGEAAAALLDLVEAGVVRLLDVALLAKDADGDVAAIDLAEAAAEAAGDFGAIAGAQSGLLSDEDLAEAGDALEPGKVGAIIVYENAWAAPFAAAVRRAGGELIASARIPAQDVLDALDALDA
ncbi:MAG: DUF1269 domain-containing protein [Microthrixaceae bacterium]|nr:DUF1269 domain-containing protein [Microthrixaceae bacterium]